MNKPEPLPSSTLLAGGEITNVTLNTGATVPVLVRLLPARHLNRFLDLRDVGHESEMLEFTVRRRLHEPGAEPRWETIDTAKPEEMARQAAFVDSLTDESHERLIEIADKLNFERAVSQAERQIAKGNALLPLKQRIAATMLAPVEASLRSLIQSLTTQALSAAAGKKP
jgi:hypothetical protein